MNNKEDKTYIDLENLPGIWDIGCIDPEMNVHDYVADYLTLRPVNADSCDINGNTLKIS